MVTLEPEDEEDFLDASQDHGDENLPNTQSLIKTSGGFMLINDLEDFDDFKGDGKFSTFNLIRQSQNCHFSLVSNILYIDLF